MAFYKYKAVEDVADEFGLIYIPNFPDGYNNFLEKRKKLQPHIDNMVDRMYFSYSVFDSDEITKQNLELIEKKCIETIGKNKLWNTRCGNCDAISISSVTGDKQLVELFRQNIR